MRHDGRKADELRSISITPNFSSFAEGSVLISFGKTQVLCNLTIENTVPRWMRIANKPGGWVTAEYAMLPALDDNPNTTGSKWGNRAHTRNPPTHRTLFASARSTWKSSAPAL